jgi:hypothetical protein
MKSRMMDFIAALVSFTLSWCNYLLTRTGCTTFAHGRCLESICIVCPTAFRPDQVRASFVRCFASLLYTYRRFLVPATGERKKAGMLYQFKMEEFMKSQPNENVQYLAALQQTQCELRTEPEKVETDNIRL